MSVAIFGCVIIGAPILGKATGQTSINTLNTASLDNLSNDAIRCYGIMENNTAVTAEQDSIFLIVLKENPTTGYRWNISFTDGLNVTADSYLPSYPERPGAGGIHVWSVKATGNGYESFNAAYERPWDNTTAGKYHLNVQVESLSFESR